MFKRKNLPKAHTFKKLRQHDHRHHDVNLIAVVDVCVGDHVVVALNVEADFVVVIVVVVQVVGDVGHDREDVHGGGEEGHLGDADGGRVGGGGTSDRAGVAQRQVHHSPSIGLKKNISSFNLLERL